MAEDLLVPLELLVVKGLQEELGLQVLEVMMAGLELQEQKASQEMMEGLVLREG